MSQLAQSAKAKPGKLKGPAILIIVAALLLYAFFYNYAADLRYCDVTPDRLQMNSAVGLKNSAVYRQEIVSVPNQAIYGLGLSFGTYMRTNHGIVTVKLYEDDAELASWSFPTTDLEDNKIRDFNLEESVVMKPDATYSFTISEKYRGQNAIGLWTDKNSARGYDIDDERQDTGCIYYTLKYNNTGLFRTIVIISVIIALAAVAMLLLKLDERIVMISILAVLLVFYLMTCPPGMAPDEWVHFIRAYEIAQGEFITPYSEETGGRSLLPTGVADFTNKESIIDWDNTSYINCSAAASYIPVGYLPQAIGIRIAGGFTNRAYNVYYGGKIGNALMCLLLCGAALCITPYGRKIMFVVMTFPMVMQQMVTMSPDGFTIALSMIFLAYVLRLAYRAERVTTRDMVLLAILGACLAFCKIVYVALLLLLFLIPAKKFQGKKSAWGFRILLIAATFLLNLLWYKFASRYTWAPSSKVDGAGQLLFLLTHVSAWIVVPVKTLIVNALFWIESMIGAYLGAITIIAPTFVWIMYCVLFVYEMCSCFVDDAEIKASDVAIVMGAFLLGAVLACLAMYMSWTDVGKETVDGVQGRYFLPVITSLAFACALARSRAAQLVHAKLSDERGNHGSFVYLMALCFNGMALIEVVKYYLV